MRRHVLDEAEVHPSVRDRVASYHRGVIDEVREAIARHDIVVVGMAINPHPGRARAYLEKRKLAFHYIGHGSYLSKWRPRTALKMWTGWGTFPMVFVKGTFVGGADDLVKLGESGELDRMLSAGATPSATSSASASA